MAPAGAGSKIARYVGFRRLVVSQATSEINAIAATDAATMIGILYFWKNCDELEPEPLELDTCCVPVVSFPPSRAATNSACAVAGFVVEINWT
jgi:hypothetical protein